MNEVAAAPSRFAEVALPVPLPHLFSYRIPAFLVDQCLPGCPVLVPMGRGWRTGVVWRVGDQPGWSEGEIRELVDLLDAEPLMGEGLRAMLEWISRYYLQPIGRVVEVALPSFLGHERKRHYRWLGERRLPEGLTPGERCLAEALLARKPGLAEETLVTKCGRVGLTGRLTSLVRQGLIDVVEDWQPRHRHRAGTAPEVTTAWGEFSAPVVPTDEQAVCAATLGEALRQGGYAPFLLEGVTGSGKTEVYFLAVEQCLALGGQALLLVPEIALTPQLVGRCLARFQEGVAVLHSGLTPRSRFDHWHRIRRGEARVVVGARSALFAPFARLSLIIVDEEHEPSYKQEEGVPYHGRDMAVVRARQEKAVLVLGSATPSMETLVNVRRGRFRHLRLTRRATGALPPRMELVDLRCKEHQVPDRPGGLLSLPLRQGIDAVLARRRQALLFLNRRGFSPTVLCTLCGYTFGCPNCSVSLTLHREKRQLICHYCDFRQPPVDVCPSCGQLSLRPMGPGTEQLEGEVRATFPTARVARLDRDAVGQGQVDLEATLEAFRVGGIDLLIGTQMVAKGHHFPGLELVGIVQAETTLCLPDFRAGERTFQLVKQVAGRAGREVREGSPSRVLIQTWDPAHYALQAALSGDVEGFAAQELSVRQECGYPPFVRLALLRVSSAWQADGEAFVVRLKARLPQWPGVVFLGPAQAPIFRLRNRFRWQLLIKGGGEDGVVQKAVQGVLLRAKELLNPRIRLEVDIDPYNFL
ncbi:MAG: primosomal protein N' [Magnetococcales bacterium]|nr:primosomal protein N' [Magnetococcales bacterium]